jgi:hypothetical protein
VVFGDRRLFTMRPVKHDLQPGCDANAERFAAWAGITLPAERLPVVPGVSTVIGSPAKGGNVDGSFADKSSWPELSPSLRAAVGLFGDIMIGPVVMLADLGPGIEMGGENFETEVFHLVVDGSCRFGDRHLEVGDAWVQPAGTRHPTVTAGGQGCSQVIILGDRSRIGSSFAHEWTTGFVGIIDELVKSLTSKAA